MKEKIVIGAALAIVLGAVLIGVAFAGTYYCPNQGTVGGVRVYCSHYISIEGSNREYFRSAAYSEAASAINRLGSDTFASREYCDGSIRTNVNQGGWVRYHSRSAVITGGLNFGPWCSNQAAGTAARHDWAHGTRPGSAISILPGSCARGQEREASRA